MSLLLKHHCTYWKQDVCYSYRAEKQKVLGYFYDSKQKAFAAFICRDVHCEWSILVRSVWGKKKKTYFLCALYSVYGVDLYSQSMLVLVKCVYFSLH